MLDQTREKYFKINKIFKEELALCEASFRGLVNRVTPLSNLHIVNLPHNFNSIVLWQGEEELQFWLITVNKIKDLKWEIIVLYRGKPTHKIEISENIEFKRNMINKDLKFIASKLRNQKKDIKLYLDSFLSIMKKFNNRGDYYSTNIEVTDNAFELIIYNKENEVGKLIIEIPGYTFNIKFQYKWEGIPTKNIICKRAISQFKSFSYEFMKTIKRRKNA